MDRGLLSGMTVVEIAHPLTEYAGLSLAGLGADVYLVETPGGSPTRQRNPRVPGHEDSPRGSIPFLARNANKKSVVIGDGDGDLLRDLLQRADLVLDADGSSFQAAVAACEPAALVTISDRRHLGVSSIVGFAASGGLSSSGWPHQPPCNAPSWLALDGAGIYAATMGVVAALARRRGSGPVRYEIPYEEAAVAAITPWTRPLMSYGMSVSGQGVVSARLGAGPYPVYEASDGYVRVLTATPRQWEAWVNLLGRPEELTTGDWSQAQYRADNFDALFYLGNSYTSQRTAEDLFTEGQRLGLTITPVYTISQFLADKHVQARDVLHAVDDPEFGPMHMLRPPFVAEPDELNVPVRPAPAPGEHTEEARAWAAAAPPQDTTPAIGVVDLARPLVGLKVLELGVGAVVPESASVLAQLGAQVVKVESLVHVDFLRQSGLNGYMDVNNCPSFNQMNLGTESIAIDMSQPEGAAVVQDLAGQCDVIMENMRGPIAGRWGLDYAAARQLREDIIYLSSQGLGRGPYGDYQTYGPNLQTFSGVTAQWAHPDDPYPVGTTLNHPDHVAGKNALVPLLAALLRRESEGAGCYIESAQFEIPTYMIGDRVLEHLVLGTEVQPIGNASRDMAPHNTYPCLNDRWVAIAVEDDEQWQRLLGVVQRPELAVPGLATTSARLADTATIDAVLAEWTSSQEARAVEAALRAAGVPVSRVVIGEDLVADEAGHISGIFAPVVHPTAGLRHHTAVPVITGDGDRPPARRAPLLGEHTERIFFDQLSLDAAHASRLFESKAAGY